MPGANRCLLRPGQTIVFEGDSLTSRRSGPNLDTWPFLRLMNWHGSWADVLSTIYSDGGHFNAVGNIIIAGEVLRAFGVKW